MNIEIKKSIKPVKYEEAIIFLEERLREINNGTKDDLIWILEHEETYKAGTSSKKEEILNKKIKLKIPIATLNEFFLKKLTNGLIIVLYNQVKILEILILTLNFLSNFLS